MSSDTGCDIAGDDKEGRSMKKRNWVCLILIAVCLAVFYGYQVLNRISTDTKPPQIRMEEQALQISVTEAKTNLLQGVTAKDEEDGNVTGSLVVESVRLLDHTGRANVTYAAFDKSGNVAKAEREFRYTDYQRPRFSLSEPLVFSQNKNIDLADYVQIQDLLDGDISHRLRAAVLSEQSLNMVGVHDVELTVTNSLGDTVKLVLPVEVYANDNSQAGLTLTEYLVYLPLGANFDAEDYLKGFSYGREQISLANGVKNGMKLKLTGEVDTSAAGVYPVSYKLTYTEEESDASYTGYSKLIVVVEG